MFNCSFCAFLHLLIVAQWCIIISYWRRNCPFWRSFGKKILSMTERKNSEARIRTNNKWTNAHYDRINIAVPKGRKDEIKTLADTQGQSVNAYIISAVDEKMERDGGTAPETAGKPAELMQGAGVVSLPSEAVKTAQEGAETG